MRAGIHDPRFRHTTSWVRMCMACMHACMYVAIVSDPLYSYIIWMKNVINTQHWPGRRQARNLFLKCFLSACPLNTFSLYFFIESGPLTCTMTPLYVLEYSQHKQTSTYVYVQSFPAKHVWIFILRFLFFFLLSRLDPDTCTESSRTYIYFTD